MPPAQPLSNDMEPTRPGKIVIGRLLWLVIPLVAGLLFSGAAHLVNSSSVTIVGGCVPSSDHYLDGQQAPQGASITYCRGGDSDKKTLTTRWLTSEPRRIDIETAGYGAAQGQTLSLETRSGRSISIPLPARGEHWTKQTVIVPRGLTNQPLRLVLKDDSNAFQSWSGLSVVSYSRYSMNFQVIAELIWILGVLHFIAAELARMLSRIWPVDKAIIASLVAIGLASWATFWTTYAFAGKGSLLGAVIAIILLLHLILSLAETKGRAAKNFHRINQLLLPISTSVMMIFIMTFYPFPHNWDTWQYGANRWLSLPMDMWLPKVFADQLWSGHVNHPMIGDWLSSDRPPLQTGFYLMFKPLAVSSGALYLIPAMWLQATCLVPLMYIVRGLGRRVNPAPIIMLITISALFLYNGGFVWPKLIAATFCAITYLALLSQEQAVEGWLGKAAFSGLGAALAMLSHGGAAFALFGIFVTYLLGRNRDTLRILAVAAGTALLVYLPWSFYQKVIDPPGTRLIAWQLAGVHAVSTQPIGEVLFQAYSHLSIWQWLHYRAANLSAMSRGMISFFTDFLGFFGHNTAQVRAKILGSSFFYFAYAQWFFTPLLAAILLFIPTRNLNNLRPLLTRPILVLLISVIFWAIVLFDPRSTVIHQGSYFLNLLSLVIVGALVLALSTRAFYLLLSLNAFVMMDAFVGADRTTTTANPALPANMQSLFWSPSHDQTYLFLVAASLILNFIIIWMFYASRKQPQPGVESSLGLFRGQLPDV